MWPKVYHILNKEFYLIEFLNEASTGYSLHNVRVLINVHGTKNLGPKPLMC